MSLSLVMIVRNEEMMLPSCLASVMGWVDEIVIADTGSTDRTREIARSTGARVIEVPWADDFAAARNAALEAATGTFVLQLDADERLAPGGGAALREAVRANAIDCGLLPLFDASRLEATPAEVLSGRAIARPPVLVPRLLRRTPDLAWRGLVREDVDAWMLARLDRISAVQAPILHFGAVPSAPASMAKQDRNAALLARRCELEPENPAPRTYLALDLLRRNDPEGATPHLVQGWELIQRATDRGERPAYVEHVTHLAARLLATGKAIEALGALERAVEWGSDHPNLDFLRGLCLKIIGSVEEPADRGRWYGAAARALHRAVTKADHLYTEPVLAEITGPEIWATLGTVLLTLGAAEAAEDVFRDALGRWPRNSELRLGFAEARLDRGVADEALRIVEPELATDRPDAWVIAAAACARLGLADERRTFVDQAKERLPRGLFAQHRAERLAALDVS
jgi:tetratricopeptide (TPR) repeat protein